MADNRNVSVFNIEINAEQAIESMNEYQKQIEQLKKAQEDLKDETKTYGKTQKQIDEEYAVNAEKIKVLNQRIAAYRKQIQNQIKSHEDNGRSLVAMRAELTNLVQQFDNLDSKTREGKVGHKLAEQIAELTKEIKGAEYATERYFRNVGNYPGKLEEAFKTVEEGFDNMGNAAQGFGGKCDGPFRSAVQGLKGIDMAMKAVYANPLIALIGVLVGILMGIANAISKNEELVNRLRVAMGPLNMVVDAFANGLDWCADKLMTLLEVMSKGLGKLLDFIGATNGLGASVSEYNKIAQETINLEKEKRDFLVESAKTEAKISELRNKAASIDKSNYNERRKLIDEAVKLEQGLADKRKEFADRELELAKRKADLAPNDKQANDELKQLEANKYNVLKEYNNKTKELNSQLTAFDEQQNKERAELAKKREEARKKELEEFKKWQEELKKAQEKGMKDRIDLLKLEIDNNEYYGRQRLNKKLELLLLERDAELANTELTEEMKLAIMRKYQKLADDAELAYQQETDKLHEEAIAKANEYVLNEMKLQESSEMEIMQKRLEQTRAMYEQLNEEDADYAEKKQKIDLSVYEQEKAIKEKQKAIDDAKTQAIKNNYEKLMDSASQMMSNDKRLASIQKTIALGKVAISEGEAIAKAIADDKGDPYTKALRIASSVASIVASFATALSSINSAKFARGGYVSGAGTSTSDSIQARLSNGESVINAKATAMYAPLLSQLNQSAGGAPINVVGAGASSNDNDFLAVQFAKAVATIQPIVSVEEFNRVSNNVKVIESNASFQ